METLFWIINVLSALVVIGLVLLQHGKGADMGAAFGSGASGSLFGARGSANFLSRATAVAAAVFFVSALGLNYLSSHKARGVDALAVPAGQPAPLANPAPAADNKAPSSGGPGEAPGSGAKDIPN
jgi:preprotein translocase subunit SecG